MLEPFYDGVIAPASLLLLAILFLADALREINEPFGGIGPAIENDVFDHFQQVPGDVLVDLQLGRIDDSHVEAGADGVIEEGGVDRLPPPLVPAQAHRDLPAPPARLPLGKHLLPLTNP